MKTSSRYGLVFFGLLVAVLFLVGQQYTFSEKLSETGEEFMGTDPYTRMVRARQLYDGGDWHDAVILRSNAPFGDELHWTRPLDVLIIGGARIFGVFMEKDAAFEASGLYVSPFLGVLSMAALLWGAVYLLGAQRAPLALIVYFSQFFVFQYFKIGRPDHHSLILLLFVLFLACAFRLLEESRWKAWGLFTALSASLAFWVSIETLVFPVLIALVLTVKWIFGEVDAMKRLGAFAFPMLLFTGFFLFIERPLANLGAIEYDKISYPYLLPLAFLALFAFFGDCLRSNRSAVRALYTLTAGLAGVYGIFRLFPEMLKGPFSDVNPAIMGPWLSKVSEVQGIMTEETGIIIYYIGIPLVGSLSLLYHLAKRRALNTSAWGFLLAGLAIYIPLGCWQVRWLAYAQVLAVLPVVLLLNLLFKRIERIVSVPFRTALRMGTVLVLCLGFFFIAVFYPVEEGKSAIEKEDDAGIWTLCRWMDTQDFGEEPIILAHIDLGPQILYRTDMRVIATPYHRNDSGILFYFDAMAEEDMETVKAMLRDRSVDLILQKVPLAGAGEPPMGNPNFKDRLISGSVPSWLVEVDLPEEIRGFRLYQTALN